MELPLQLVECRLSICEQDASLAHDGCTSALLFSELLLIIILLFGRIKLVDFLTQPLNLILVVLFQEVNLLSEGVSFGREHLLPLGGRVQLVLKTVHLLAKFLLFALDLVQRYVPLLHLFHLRLQFPFQTLPHFLQLPYRPTHVFNHFFVFSFLLLYFHFYFRFRFVHVLLKLVKQLRKLHF